VQGTPGAELHPGLDRERVDAVVDTGQDPAVEGYSGFQETGLADLLREHGIGEVTVVGLATDYCVKHTALDALDLGHRVTVDARATRAVDVRPGDGDRALAEVEAAGGTVRR
jgi:nicotinamidase/pyrazinamidase